MCIRDRGTTVDYILEGVNKYMLALAKEQIKICFEQAEKEVKDLRRRTIEGIETARLNGDVYKRQREKRLQQHCKWLRFLPGVFFFCQILLLISLST